MIFNLFLLVFFVSKINLPTVTTTQDHVNQNGQVIGATSQTAKVIRVVDGDTFEIENGVKVRLIGIDTPEVVDPRKPVQCFAKEASNETKSLIEGSSVSLVKDISETDKYGRLLRYVYKGDLLVNDYLVRNGYAKASTVPPDVAMSTRFLDAQKEASVKKLGLWSKCI